MFADREQALRWKNSVKPPSWPWCRGRRDKIQRICVGDNVSVTLINPLWTFPVVIVIQSLSPFWLCNPMDCNLPGSSVHGISQAKIQDWAAISSSRGASQPRDRTHVSCTGRWILYHWATWEVVKTPCSHFRVHRFHPWSRKIPHTARPNNNTNKVIFYKAFICGTVPERAHI